MDESAKKKLMINIDKLKPEYQKKVKRYVSDLLSVQDKEDSVGFIEGKLSEIVDGNRPAAKESDDGSAEERCSFCGKSKSEVERLFSGNGNYICDECIEVINGVDLMGKGLFCSCCGKGVDDVKRLYRGEKMVYICDECVAVCDE